MENMETIYKYSHQQAVDDGVLVEILPHRWPQLTNGKPLLATIAVYTEFSMAAIMEIWNYYVAKKSQGYNAVPFRTRMNSKEVWVMSDDEVFTILFPSDY